MTRITSTGLLLLVLSTSAQAQATDRIYRCGNAYTNTVTQEEAKKCKLIEGGNLTVVQGTLPAKASSQPSAGSTASTPSSGPRVNSVEQKSRDSDARLILQAELKNAEERHAELLKEYNNGTPDRRNDEGPDSQRYRDRVADLKAKLLRNESDIAGIRRELERLPASTAAR
ncbi:hypothetical protein [Rhodoferax sp.]|uniref:hypothetical protein n=1 Tax=Rhodoferax sp. TaxID=50421 RepID=UPI0025F6B0B8|nr:hypothetical protein [Rhodoferax sp.]